MYELQLTEVVAGYSTGAVRQGESAIVRVSDATSIEDGDLHLKYLEGFPQQILSQISHELAPSKIESMVVLISKKLKATIYINEVSILANAYYKEGNLKVGEPVTKENISGYERISFENLSLPKDHAFFCILPVGWDQLFLFDF